MKIYLSGQKSFGLEVFLLLQKLGHEIVGVAAPREDANGRTDKLFGYADAYRFPMTDAKALRATDIPAGTDLIVCAHSHAYVGRKTREATRYGAIGYHPSLLPRHRGRDAVKWTIKMRDPIAGGSVFWLNDSVDCGDIAAQEWCFVDPNETAHSLWRDKLFPLGLALINKVLKDIERERIVRIRQDETYATFEPAMNPPRLFRPELIQLGAGGKSAAVYQVENKFAETMRLYSVD